jgi:hypothetical protein
VPKNLFYDLSREVVSGAKRSAETAVYEL